jgi:hypothetical protein
VKEALKLNGRMANNTTSELITKIIKCMSYNPSTPESKNNDIKYQCEVRRTSHAYQQKPSIAILVHPLPFMKAIEAKIFGARSDKYYDGSETKMTRRISIMYQSKLQFSCAKRNPVYVIQHRNLVQIHHHLCHLRKGESI